MAKENDPIQNHLKLLRNLCVSPFYGLAKAEDFYTYSKDPQLFNRLGGLIFKVRSRFESYKVLSQTLDHPSNNDGTHALAESMISHVNLIHELLESAGIADHADQFEVECHQIIETVFPTSSFTGATPDKVILKEAQHLPVRLKKIAPPLVVYWFLVSLAVRHSKSICLSQPNGIAHIIREISFPPEYQQAGLSILNYFSEVLAFKYPDIPVTISIKQEPNLVTLHITLPDGTQDIISKTLSDYGLVVTERMSPKDLMQDEFRALALQQKLDLAQLEVKQTRDLLRIQERYANDRIESLEGQVKNLYALLGREFTSREKLQEGLMELTRQMSSGHIGEQATQLLNALSEAIADRNAERTRIILEDIQTAEPDIFSRLHGFFIQATSSGIIGNFAYDWLKVLWPVLPK